MTRALRCFPLLVLLALSTGCEPEPPPPKNPTCWPNTSPQPHYEGCDEERCVEKETKVAVDTKLASEAEFRCEYCGNLKPEDVATDTDGKITAQVRFGAEGVGLELRFDNRAMQAPTLEKLRQYAIEAILSYSPPQGGTMGVSYIPFEVVSYEGGRMRVKLDATLHDLNYWVDGTFPCLPGGHGCSVQCYHGDSTAGGSGVPMQFSADLTAPLTITPFTY